MPGDECLWCVRAAVIRQLARIGEDGTRICADIEYVVPGSSPVAGAEGRGKADCGSGFDTVEPNVVVSEDAEVVSEVSDDEDDVLTGGEGR